MNPVFSQAGQLLGWLSNNVLFGANGKNVAFVRGEAVYSNENVYWGRLEYRRGRIEFVEKSPLSGKI